jgi:hypothetical protein
MEKSRKPWFRGVLTLSVLAIFGAAMLISNANAVKENKEASKRFVKKRVAAGLNQLRSEFDAVQAAAPAEEFIGLSNSFTSLLSLDLPAGTYVLMAKTVITLPIETPHCECQILVGGTIVDKSEGSISEGQDIRAGEVTLMAVHALAAPADVVLQCRSENGGQAAAAFSPKLVAIRVP